VKAHGLTNREEHRIRSGKTILTERDIIKGEKKMSAGEIAGSSIDNPTVSKAAGPAVSDISARPADISQTQQASSGLQLPEVNLPRSGSPQIILTESDIIKLGTGGNE
jgi:hypothetical protein